MNYECLPAIEFNQQTGINDGAIYQGAGYFLQHSQCFPFFTKHPYCYYTGIKGLLGVGLNNGRAIIAGGGPKTDMINFINAGKADTMIGKKDNQAGRQALRWLLFSFFLLHNTKFRHYHTDLSKADVVAKLLFNRGD